MKNPPLWFVAAILVAGALGDFFFPAEGYAWGTVFTARARQAALGQLSFSLDGVTEPSLDPDWGSGAALDLGGPDELATEVQTRVDALAAAFSSRDPIQTQEALDRLVLITLRLWQPLDAASLFDPPGAARGFHFRYETLLAARIATQATLPLSPGRRAGVVGDPAGLALAIARERSAMIPMLAAAEGRARTESGGLFDDRYYAALARDLGVDLGDALRGAADTVADLIETAWAASDVSRQAVPAAIDMHPLGVGSGRWAARFFLAAPAQVTATLYAPTGRRVATLAESAMPAGFHELAADLDGASLPSGVYFLRLEAGTAAATAKLPLFH